jgi:hypothetical protein
MPAGPVMPVMPVTSVRIRIRMRLDETTESTVDGSSSETEPQ